MTLGEYFTDNCRKGIIDFSIRALPVGDGSFTFYIHPTNKDGNTCNFVVRDNEIESVGVMV